MSEGVYNFKTCFMSRVPKWMVGANEFCSKSNMILSRTNYFGIENPLTPGYGSQTGLFLNKNMATHVSITLILKRFFLWHMEIVSNFNWLLNIKGKWSFYWKLCRCYLSGFSCVYNTSCALMIGKFNINANFEFHQFRIRCFA